LNEQFADPIQGGQGILSGFHALPTMETPIMPHDRTFRVHARHLDAHHASTMVEPSFEAAAVAYVEQLHQLPPDGEAISVIVREIESGHEHCFRIDLDSGETSPCA
jgi:hypothetical protein